MTQLLRPQGKVETKTVRQMTLTAGGLVETFGVIINGRPKKYFTSEKAAQKFINRSLGQSFRQLEIKG